MYFMLSCKNLKFPTLHFYKDTCTSIKRESLSSHLSPLKIEKELMQI